MLRAHVMVHAENATLQQSVETFDAKYIIPQSCVRNYQRAPCVRRRARTDRIPPSWNTLGSDGDPIDVLTVALAVGRNLLTPTCLPVDDLLDCLLGVHVAHPHIPRSALCGRRGMGVHEFTRRLTNRSTRSEERRVGTECRSRWLL